MEIVRHRNESGYLRFKCPLCDFVNSRGISVIEHARSAHGVELEGYKPRPRTPGSAPSAAAQAPSIVDLGDIPETVLVVVHAEDGAQQAYRLFNVSYGRVCETVQTSLRGLARGRSDGDDD